MTKYQKIKLILLTVFGILFLMIFYNFSENGRYSKDSDGLTIIDSKTGTIYFADGVIEISNEGIKRK